MTDKQLYIPATEEEALDKLKNENYLKNDYQRRRNAGQSLEEAWLAIWTMVELSGDELDQIIPTRNRYFAGCKSVSFARKDSEIAAQQVQRYVFHVPHLCRGRQLPFLGAQAVQQFQQTIPQFWKQIRDKNWT